MNFVRFSLDKMTTILYGFQFSLDKMSEIDGHLKKQNVNSALYQILLCTGQESRKKLKNNNGKIKKRETLIYSHYFKISQVK